MRNILLIVGMIFILNQGVYAKYSSGFLLNSASGQFQNEEDIKEILSGIETKFGIHITYESGVLSHINIKNGEAALKTKTLTESFDVLLKDSPLTYKMIRDDFYVILKTENKAGSSISEITGTILDEQDNPIPGASIVISGTQTGTTSDINGNFRLKISPSAKTLLVSFLGYKKTEVTIGDRANLIIKLERDLVGLDEVIVTAVAGNTSVKKMTVTVAKVNAKELNEAPASSASTALQGKVAGVRVVQGSGVPGTSSSIRLRGTTSLTGDNAPLILMDGNIFESSLADINVDDIKSMEVVKGAAAASLYGSKAGSGVILITTYRGNEQKEDKTTVKVRNEFGTSAIAKTIELNNTHPYLLAQDAGDFTNFTKYSGVKYDEEGNVVRGSRKLDADHFSDNPYGFVNDNQDKFFYQGNYYTNYISVANQSKKTNVFLSFENNKQTGILFSTDGYNRQNFRVNVDLRLHEKLKLSTSNLLINSKSDNPGSENSFFDLLFLNPDVDLEKPNKDGTPYLINPDTWSIEENPLYPLYYRERISTRTSILSNLVASFSPYSWLNFDAKYTIEMRFNNWSTYTPRGYLYGGGQYIDGSIYKEEYRANFQTFQATANFSKIIKKFTFKGKLSYLYEDESYNDFSVTGREFIVADIPQLNNTNAEKSTLNSYEGIIRAENFFGILDFDYRETYLFSALYRKDGSSLFGSDQRWNDYYRVSAAYRISEDVKIPGIDELKIRTAYGTAGQRPMFSNQYETWNITNGALQKSTLGNKDLKPSESAELEIALDAYFLHKFNMQLSYSETNTRNAFALAPLPSHLGYPNQWSNVGTINSKVFEASLGINLVEKKDIQWKVNFIFDRIRQKITKLNVPEYQTGPNNAFVMREGETFGAIYGYKWVTSLSEMEAQLQSGQSISDYTLNSDGFVIKQGTEGTVSEAPILWDKDANGVADQTKIGDGNPTFNLGVNTTFTWKNFQFYALFDIKHGGEIYNYTHQYTFRDNRAIEFDQSIKAETEKKTIDYYANFYYHTALNSFFIEDASFVKLRELSVYYDIPNKNMGGLKNFISSMRFGIIGHNLYTFTEYSGYDPEVASGSDMTNYPFDNFGYPNYRTFKASIEINF
jgi:TonB-linked SusC/RagA family outer membrane protein